MPSFAFDAIGTRWTIDTAASIEGVIGAAVRRRAEEFDATYSRFRPDSLVSVLSRRATSVRFPDDGAALFSFYDLLYRVTNGAVNPLVGGALEHLGYGPGYSLRRGTGTVTVPAWDQVVHVDGSVMTTTRPVVLDVGAAGKGYLVDLLGILLETAGVHEYLINGGGDLLHAGPSPCRVGLEDPVDDRRVVGVATLDNAALCGSAVNRRRWGQDLHHILDTSTGEPTTDITATWVAAGRAMIADGLSTALFFTDPAVLAREFTFSYVLMPATGGIQSSTDFDGELFT